MFSSVRKFLISPNKSLTTNSCKDHGVVSTYVYADVIRGFQRNPADAHCPNTLRREDPQGGGRSQDNFGHDRPRV